MSTHLSQDPGTESRTRFLNFMRDYHTASAALSGIADLIGKYAEENRDYAKRFLEQDLHGDETFLDGLRILTERGRDITGKLNNCRNDLVRIYMEAAKMTTGSVKSWVSYAVSKFLDRKKHSDLKQERETMTMVKGDLLKAVEYVIHLTVMVAQSQSQAERMKQLMTKALLEHMKERFNKAFQELTKEQITKALPE
ncbi:PREDICTED: uncharacterized protein LOC104815304 [Tarenaya hassleriana]|uniref:uncharacterized protein LOC104815304 n=1 Tax=Tarenaya hassleriana TaxID=28532 RepID=UPI00053C4954|nr:PREDICTED: uncharacterized protein LOC104815304 [Tarenaya hassleriana]